MGSNAVRGQIASNIFKTYLIMFSFALFVVGVVYIFARGFGFAPQSALSFSGTALLLAGVMNFVSYFFSDKMVLAISGAKQIKREENPDIYKLVESVCRLAKLPMPKVYIMDDSSPNAFATGRNKNHAAICFTSGILQKLDNKELEGVISHELSHVNNRDTLVMSIVSVLVGFVALLSDWFLRMSFFRGNDEERGGGGVFMIVALVASIISPLIATLIQLAISRRREYLADVSGAVLTHHPEELASALAKISSDKKPLEAANRATAHLYIVNPFKADGAMGAFINLFNTHPPIEERIKILRGMVGRV